MRSFKQHVEEGTIRQPGEHSRPYGVDAAERRRKNDGIDPHHPSDVDSAKEHQKSGDPEHRAAPPGHLLAPPSAADKAAFGKRRFNEYTPNQGEILGERVSVDGRTKGYRDALSRITARHQAIADRAAAETEPEVTDDVPEVEEGWESQASPEEREERERKKRKFSTTKRMSDSGRDDDRPIHQTGVEPGQRVPASSAPGGRVGPTTRTQKYIKANPQSVQTSEYTPDHGEMIGELTSAQKAAREASRKREFGGKAGKVSKYGDPRQKKDPGVHHPDAKKQRGATGPDSDYHHGSQATGSSKAQELRGFKGMTARQKYHHLDKSAKAKLLKKARRTAKARQKNVVGEYTPDHGEDLDELQIAGEVGKIARRILTGRNPDDDATRRTNLHRVDTSNRVAGTPETPGGLSRFRSDQNLRALKKKNREARETQKQSYTPDHGDTFVEATAQYFDKVSPTSEPHLEEGLHPTEGGKVGGIKVGAHLMPKSGHRGTGGGSQATGDHVQTMTHHFKQAGPQHKKGQAVVTIDHGRKTGHELVKHRSEVPDHDITHTSTETKMDGGKPHQVTVVHTRHPTSHYPTNHMTSIAVPTNPKFEKPQGGSEKNRAYKKRTTGHSAITIFPGREAPKASEFGRSGHVVIRPNDHPEHHTKTDTKTDSNESYVKSAVQYFDALHSESRIGDEMLRKSFIEKHRKMKQLKKAGREAMRPQGHRRIAATDAGLDWLQKDEPDVKKGKK